MQVKRLIVGPLATNCYLLISKNELAVVDPGGGVNEILEEIKKTGIKVKYIINTHYHFDHTLANSKIKEATGAKVLIHRAEKNFINFKPDKFLKEGNRIRVGDSVLKVIHTPGHTKGSISLTGEGFVITGDTLFKDGHGRTDLAGGSLEDIEKSLDKLSKLLKPGTKVYPGHGEIFEI